MGVTGSLEVLRITTSNPESKAPEDVSGLVLVVTDPDGNKQTVNQGELTHDDTGKYHYDYLTELSGLHHYRWTITGATAAEGFFTAESAEDALIEGAPGEPDLKDLRVLVQRARRKIEGPFGDTEGRPPLADSMIYAMVADACGEVIMLSGNLFHHQLLVKERDSLGGFPTEWETDTVLTEWEAAVIVAQVALNYYFHVFRNKKISETINNEGTTWEYQLSANVIRSYLEAIIEERDKAIAGLRANLPVLDRYASNIRVRDQATVAVLEWWAGQYDAGTPGGLPGGQEAAVVPVFFPPGGF